MSLADSLSQADALAAVNGVNTSASQALLWLDALAVGEEQRLALTDAL